MQLLELEYLIHDETFVRLDCSALCNISVSPRGVVWGTSCVITHTGASKVRMSLVFYCSRARETQQSAWVILSSAAKDLIASTDTGADFVVLRFGVA